MQRLFYMCNNLCSPTTAVCYREVSAIKGSFVIKVPLYSQLNVSDFWLIHEARKRKVLHTLAPLNYGIYVRTVCKCTRYMTNTCPVMCGYVCILLSV